MEEQLITFETAKLTKEKGFDVKTKNWYDQTKTLNPTKVPKGAMVYTNEGYAPTQSLLQKWLREVHNIHIEIIPNKNKWHTVMYPLICIDDVGHFGDWYTYEEALEKGLQEALKLI